MTKKRAPFSPSFRTQLWFLFQLAVSLSVIACVLALLKIQSQPVPPVAVHFEEVEFLGTPKVAFLFLARADLPLDFIWHGFFQNAEEGNFSIYVHSRPGFVFDESTTRSHFFFGRQLENSIQVAWGEASMIEAERILLSKALEDPANQRFVLLSESCVPLYNFSYTYGYLMSSSKSFVDSFLDKKEGRYNPMMFPTVPQDRWRKGSQWVTLVRKHAVVVASDNTIFPVFKRHCKRRPDLGLEGNNNVRKIVQKEHNCIPDEHYVQTLLSMSRLEDELERRTLTYTSWNQSKTGEGKQSWHPITFMYEDASPQHIKQIKDVTQVYYETEFRTEWCQSNSTFVPCFLFARKFSRGAAARLLAAGVVGPFDASSLLLAT